MMSLFHLFRGKHIKTGEWLYGSYYNDGGEDYILENSPGSYFDAEDRQIDGNTLGLYIGTDASGKKMFTGDYVKSIGGKVFKIEWDRSILKVVARNVATREIFTVRNKLLYTVGPSDDILNEIVEGNSLRIKLEKTCICLESCVRGGYEFSRQHEYQVDIEKTKREETYKVYNNGGDHDFILLDKETFEHHFRLIE